MIHNSMYKDLIEDNMLDGDNDKVNMDINNVLNLEFRKFINNI